MVDVQEPPTSSFITESTICINETLTVQYTGTMNNEIVSYWDFENATIVNGSVFGPYEIEFNDAGEYTFELLVDENGCRDSSYQIIEVHPVDETEQIIESCDTFLWNGNFYDQSGNYIFETINTFGCDSTVFLDLTLFNSFDTIIEQSVCSMEEVGMFTNYFTTNKGCDSVVTEIFFLGDQLELELGDDITIDNGESIEIIANLQGDQSLIDTIIWEGYPFIDCNNCLSQTISPTDSVFINLLIIDINGCVYSDEIVISIRRSEEIFTPNIFSPNNDGINDFFTLFGDNQKIINVNFLRVYDRWGNHLFEAQDLVLNDEYTGWDGTYLGKNLNPGVYVWHAEVLLDTGETVSYKGDISLIR
jgi:gliding motility-associated-like protein